jgi:predicted small metal-binding protein
MKSILLRCRDAGMFGPFCDYVTSAASFEEAIRELRVHTKTHHERDITIEEMLRLKQMLEEHPGSRSAA